MVSEKKKIDNYSCFFWTFDFGEFEFTLLSFAWICYQKHVFRHVEIRLLINQGSTTMLHYSPVLSFI